MILYSPTSHNSQCSLFHIDHCSLLSISHLVSLFPSVFYPFPFPMLPWKRKARCGLFPGAVTTQISSFLYLPPLHLSLIALLISLVSIISTILHQTYRHTHTKRIVLSLNKKNLVTICCWVLHSSIKYCYCLYSPKETYTTSRSFCWKKKKPYTLLLDYYYYIVRWLTGISAN